MNSENLSHVKNWANTQTTENTRLRLKDKNRKRKERGSIAAEVATKPSSNQRVNESSEKRKICGFLVMSKTDVSKISRNLACAIEETLGQISKTASQSTKVVSLTSLTNIKSTLNQHWQKEDW